MRYTVLVLILFLLTASTVFISVEDVNADDLLNVLMDGHRPAKNEKAAFSRGCLEGTNDCSAYFEDIIVLRERKAIQLSGGKHIRLKQYAPGDPKDLPEMDWDPGSGYKVFRAGKRWGMCLHFDHGGLGKSGHSQRWSSIVLVPWKGSRPGLVAHRFVGYWANCSSLAEGDKEGEIMMPIIEPVKIGSSPLHLVWYHCTAERCIKVKDKRKVNGFADSESGELVIK